MSATKSFKLSIDNDGALTMIYDDEHRGLIESAVSVEITRASHVEPNWQGDWVADLAPVGGPKLGPFQLRSDALDAEVAWLNQHMF